MKQYSVLFPFFMAFGCMISGSGAVASTQEMTLEQVLQRVIDHYPSLKTAAIQVERARQSSKKVGSQLGWQLSAQTGLTRDVTLFGTATDVINIGGSLSRTLESGSTLSVEAVARRQDSEGVFSPVIPNPVTSTSIDITYRQPLGRGSDNPLYVEGLASAKAEVAASKAESETLYEQIASQVIDLYIAAATVQAKIHNNERSIIRTGRLQDFIKDRASLGVAEDKDILQVNAQLDSLRAQLSALQTSWQKQLISLNRLMGRKWSSGLVVTTKLTTPDIPESDFNVLFKAVKEHSSKIHSANARIELADSAIRKRRDERKNNIDLVLFVGNRTQEGSTNFGDISESEVVGGIRLEFSESVDKKGVDAELYQAQLDRSAALQDKRQLIEDLQYELSSLLAETNANMKAINAYKTSVSSEQKKLENAMKRYRTGRTDTDQLIQFEDQLSKAEFALELQRLELMKRKYNLSLLQGKLWDSINLPVYDNFVIRNIKASRK